MTADFRSDTVTRPTPAMRAAMAAAPVGDDVFGDDPSVNALEAETAGLLGFEAALFVPSGTQSNLIGVITHCARGDEYIVGQEAHTYRYEAGGAAVLGSVQPQPLDNARDGTLPLAAIEAAIKPDDPHFARTRLIALENTIGGASVAGGLRAGGARARRPPRPRAAPRRRAAVERRGEAGRGAARHRAGLRFGLGVPVEGARRAGRIAAVRRARFHPGRAALAQDAGRRHAPGRHPRGRRAATRWRTTFPRLAEDHDHAARLAAGLARHGELDVAPAQTNMVFVGVPPAIAAAFAAHLAADGVLITGTTRQRWVTHLDVGAADVDRALASVDRFFDEARNASLA